ncbi:MAG TPA: AIR synthase-related protein, partial [Terriglobia bacterium]|nr:AIR synthase-related protein [Terriglobia bacterium]
EKESAAVQIGHPITERRFTSAIPALRDAGCIRSITDLGAGGISCGAGEMGAEMGVSLNLDVVPLKDESLTAWEILLSESQERMLIAVPPEKLSEAQSLLDRYEVSHTVIGQFTDSKRLEASWHGQRVVNLGMDFLWGACPIDPIPSAESRRTLAALSLREPRSGEEWSEAVRRVMGHYHCADQSAAGTRFDSTVQGRTVIGPYAGKNHRMPTGIFVAAPLPGKNYGLISTLALNPFYGEINPVLMAKLMVIEAVTKAVVAGADYREIGLCDNFYTPRVRPGVAWELTRMVENIAALSCGLGTPFISGKDSSSGTFEAAGGHIDVPLTLAVAALGRIKDAKRAVTKDFKRAGNKILLVGQIDSTALGGTVYADAYGQRGDSLFDGYNADAIRTLWDSVMKLHEVGAYFSGAALGEGGVALRVFEAAFGSGLGVRLDLNEFEKAQPAALAHQVKARRDGLLFGEFIGSVLLEVGPDFEPAALLPEVPSTVIGEVLAAPSLILSAGGETVWREEVSSLVQVWSATFREVLE